jgi:dolichyl-phosphate beta-glucosyltransferase
MKEYSIVIPAYNEADKISSTLNKVITFMDSFGSEYEILVVDDGSTDATAKKVSDMAAENNNIVLIKNIHKGKGIAVWTGVMHSKGLYIYLCDADLSAPITELKKLSIWITEHNFDLVIASREGVGAKRIGEPFYRHLMGRVFNIFTQLITLRGIKDTQCGFKLFKSDVAKLLFTNLKVYNPQNPELTGAYMGAFDVEVLFLARKLGYTIKEVPVTWTYVNTTRLAPMRDSLRMLRDIIKIRINDVKGVYKKVK